LVPTDALRSQLSRDAEDDARALGVPIVGAVDVTKEAKDLRNSFYGYADVFVATYAQVARDDGFFRDLMGHGTWLVVRDECHRLREDRAWGQATAALGGKRQLNLTATPVRSDGAKSVAVPSREAGDGTVTVEADVVVSIRDAIQERALRAPVGRVQHYFVDVQSADGEVRRITTDDLREQNVTDFSSYETRKSLRYCRKYLSKMLIEIVQRWNEKNMYPGHENQHQALVFAMSNGHAQALTEQLNELGGDGFADWIGQDRDEKTNDKVLNKYLGYQRQGKRVVEIPDSQRLPCLVQVDMASEGFNNKRTSILAFLHLIRSNAKLAQQIGRGLRRNPNIEDFHEDVCDVFASADTEIADYVNRLEVELKGTEAEKDTGEGNKQERLPLGDIPELPVLDAEWHRTEIVTPTLQRAETARHQQLRQMAATYGIQASPEQLEQFITAFYGGSRPGGEPSAQFQSQGAKETYWRDQANRAVKTLAHNVVRLRSNGSFERSLLADTISAVHKRWVKETGLRAGQMTANEHQRKYEWARQINDNLKETKEVPFWAAV
jgi:superfamily II DNA or RNA helicase